MTEGRALTETLEALSAACTLHGTQLGEETAYPADHAVFFLSRMSAAAHERRHA